MSGYLPRLETGHNSKFRHLSGTQTETDAGGMQLGRKFCFVTSDEMPKLDLERIIDACNKLIEGVECYSALTYLSRVRTVDIDTVIESTRSLDVRERWQRLWVLSSVLARIARTKSGQARLAEHFSVDLAALHMLTKFDPQQNSAIKRFFERSHDALLERVLVVLVQFKDDTARSALVGGIIAVIENDADILRDKLIKHTSAEGVDEILALIPFGMQAKKERGRLSSTAILERLRMLSQNRAR